MTNLDDLKPAAWYIATDLFRRNGQPVAGPFATRLDATIAREEIEKTSGVMTYWVDRTPRTVINFKSNFSSIEPGGKYDFYTPADLETRVEHLIDWWRCQAQDAGDDGSITVMADQLERVLHKSEVEQVDPA